MISMDAQTQNTLDKLYTAETAYEKIKTEKEEVAAQLRLLEDDKKGSIRRSKELFFSSGPGFSSIHI